ncbi:DEAD DEAH box helicase, partial [Spiromyces aspiralis]
DGYSEGPAGNWRLEKYEPSRFKCIIIDEAHHASAQTYRRILRHFAADTSDCQIYVWGCSATLRRYDGLGLAGVFDEITYQRPFLSMIKEGWLCGIRVTSIETRTDLNGVRKLGDDLALASLSRAVNNLERNKLIVDAYRKFAQGSRRSTVVFAVNVNHVKALVKAFSDAGIEAATITASTNRNDRVEILRAFSERRIPVLINCGILTEGTDIPAIDCVMMARPTRSPVLFQQMLGRGMRLYPGKADCLVLDFVDTFRPGTDMVTVPTLMGLDPEVLVKDQLFDKQTIKDPDNARCSALSLKDGEQQHNKEDEDGGGYQGLPPAESLLLSSPDQIIARHHRNPYAIFELKQEAGATKALWQP